jgi:hypothetical protein
MIKLFNILGLLIGFTGSILAFLDSWRTGSRFDSEAIKLGFEPELDTWFWRHCGQMGFALLTLGFLMQLIAVCLQP